jgi:hypothetical protein
MAKFWQSTSSVGSPSIFISSTASTEQEAFDELEASYPAEEYSVGTTAQINGSQDIYYFQVVETSSTIFANFTTNGGTPSSYTSQSSTSGSLSVTVPGIPTRTGYLYNNWSPSLPRTITVTTTFITQWTPITYSVRYNPNGGTGSATTQTGRTYDVSFNLTSLSTLGFSRTGYTFLGWSTNSSAVNPTYSDGESVENLTFTNNAIVDLFAIWIETSGGKIFINVDEELPNSEYSPSTNPSYYAKGFRSPLNSSTERIIGSVLNYSNYLTRTIARNTTSFIDVVEQNTDIYIGDSRVKIINPNKIIRPVARYTLSTGTTYNLSNLPKTNTNNSTDQDAIILLQGSGGGGASGRIFSGDNDAGGAGGGAGATALVKLENISSYSISLGTGGAGGVYNSSTNLGGNGSAGGDARILLSGVERFAAKGGLGGLQRNQGYTFPATGAVTNDGGLPGKIFSNLPAFSYAIYTSNASTNTYFGTYSGSITNTSQFANPSQTLTIVGGNLSSIFSIGNRVEKESGTAVLERDSRIVSVSSELRPDFQFDNIIGLSGLYNPNAAPSNGTVTVTIYRSGFGGKSNEIGRGSIVGVYSSPLTLGSFATTGSNTSTAYTTRAGVVMNNFSGGSLNGDNNIGRGGSGAASLFANGGIGPFGLSPGSYSQNGTSGLYGSGGGGSSCRAAEGNIVSGSSGGTGFIIVFY